MQNPSDESNHLSAASIDAAIQDRAGKIEQLQREQVTLRRRRNAFALISRLPEEILCEIFLDVVRFFNTSLTKRSDWPQQWLTVSHICHHWREVVLAFPQFWDHVVLQRPAELLNMFLERSGQSPLTIAGSTLQHRPRKTKLPSGVLLDTLGQQAHRIQCLEGFILQRRIAELLAKVMTGLGTTFSMLETFAVSFGRETFPPNLFTSEGMPRLRHLSCTNPPTSFLRSIRNCPLTTLHISSWTEEQTVVVWANAIRHFTALQTLDIADIVPVFSPDIDGALGSLVTNPVHLPKLQTLRLSSTYSLASYARFIECCTFPRTTKVRVEFKFQDDTNRLPNEVEYMSSLSSSASRLGLSFASCYIYSDDISTLQVNLWEDVIPAPALHEATNPAWQLLFPPHAIPYVFTAFISEFSLPRLHSLSVSTAGGVPYRNGLAQLDRHPTIKELAFSGRLLTVEFLGIARQQSVLPNLELLILRDVAFKKHRKLARQRKERSLAYDLEEMLRVRKDEGVPVKRLRIIEARLLQDYDVGRLEEVVEEVAWSYAESNYVYCQSCEEDWDSEE